MNPFSIESWFCSNDINERHNKRVMGKIWVAGKRTTLGEELSWGETRSGGTGGSLPGQRSWSVSSRVRPISPSHWELRGTRRGPSWVEYRSGGTGAPHPGMDIFPGLSPAKGCASLPPLFIWRQDWKTIYYRAIQEYVKVILGIKSKYIEIGATWTIKSTYAY